ncbi:MAG: SemiSWEET transporter [Candidatus Micrarchaeota archaeon]|nr:SemiSWEET transporter [Candidatus Micrarchaeota archaeon]
MLSQIDILGFVAGALTTIAVLPQIIKSYRTRKTKDISWGWLGIMTSGNGLWAIYGFVLASLPILITNVIAFSFQIILILLKRRHG